MDQREYIMVQGWLKALFSETLVCVWLVLSALSTLATFFIHGLSGQWRAGSLISLILGFALANYRVFRKKAIENDSLQRSREEEEVWTSELMITPQGGSRYILHPLPNLPHPDFKGGWLEFHLMVENAGRKKSTVTDFELEIMELRLTFQDLKPVEGIQFVQGRHCGHGVDYGKVLSQTGILRVDSESTTNRGILLFYIPDLDLQAFLSSGLQMLGEQRRLPPLHCRLTLTDTSKSSAAADFELQEN